MRVGRHHCLRQIGLDVQHGAGFDEYIDEDAVGSYGRVGDEGCIADGRLHAAYIE